MITEVVYPIPPRASRHRHLWGSYSHQTQDLPSSRQIRQFITPNQEAPVIKTTEAINHIQPWISRNRYHWFSLSHLNTGFPVIESTQSTYHIKTQGFPSSRPLSQLITLKHKVSRHRDHALRQIITSNQGYPANHQKFCNYSFVELAT